MSKLRKLGKYCLNSLKHYHLRVDSHSIAKDIAGEIPIDQAQIEYWDKQFKIEGHYSHHPYVQVAQFYTNVGLHERASDFYLRFLKKAKDKIVHSLYLQNLLLSATATSESLLLAHQEWAKENAPQFVKTSNHSRNKKQAGEKIKVAYLCFFFTNSISQNCLLPLLKMHDRNKFEIYCYNDGEMPENKELYADHWYDTRGMSDAQLANLIQKDGIDILQELNGFIIINRFGVLAHRPAPIQINWYNHTSTTGLPFVDYVMSDVVSIADSEVPHFVEYPYRHKHFIAAVRFDPKVFGEVTQTIPYEKNGYITFCYFGGSHKITLQSIAIWARVLKAVPNAKLWLKCSAFNHERYRDTFIQHFAKEGISTSRFILEGWSDQSTTLGKYNEVDIMLDNATVNGGSTLFEALIQGVPTVTLMGKRWATRSGPSVLTTLNHPELIAHSEDEYVNIATRLANDVTTLKQYRSTLRQEMLDSPLTNIQSFYQNFEQAYLFMWDRWCQQGTIGQ
jgi:protein O-GlcNAc transferase